MAHSRFLSMAGCGALAPIPFIWSSRRPISAARGPALAAAYKTWTASRQAIAARLPAYRTAQRLVEGGAHGQAPAMAGIHAHRRLLDEPDPVPPLRQDAAAELRSTLNAAYAAYGAALHKAEADLRTDPAWQALDPADKHAIRAANGLLPEPPPPVASPEDIVQSLAMRGVAARAALTRGLPAGVLAALDEAAERALPEVQSVTLPVPGTLADAAAEAWLGVVRSALGDALLRGPVRPRF